MTAPDPVGAVQRWAEEMAGRWRSILPEMRAVYLAGSASTGGFNPTVSDVDVVAVVEAPMVSERLERVRAAVVAAGQPPAAGGLDLEVFALAEVRELARGLGWHAWIRWYSAADPHLEAGAPPDLADWAPALAIARRCAIAVMGPPPSEVIGPVPHELLLAACLAEITGWGENYQPHWSLAGGVLAACRAWWYWAERGLGSKIDAGRWALAKASDPEPVRRALEHQLTGLDQGLTLPEAAAFVAGVADRVSSPPPPP